MQSPGIINDNTTSLAGTQQEESFSIHEEFYKSTNCIEYYLDIAWCVSLYAFRFNAAGDFLWILIPQTGQKTILSSLLVRGFPTAGRTQSSW